MLIPVDSANITQLYSDAHKAIDIGVPVQTQVRSTHTGRVYRGTSDILGNYIVVYNPRTNRMTVYAHLSCWSKPEHKRVRVGTVIGHSGNSGLSTGPHLHYAEGYYQRAKDKPWRELTAHALHAGARYVQPALYSWAASKVHAWIVGSVVSLASLVALGSNEAGQQCVQSITQWSQAQPVEASPVVQGTYRVQDTRPYTAPVYYGWHKREGASGPIVGMTTRNLARVDFTGRSVRDRNGLWHETAQGWWIHDLGIDDESSWFGTFTRSWEPE